MNCSAHDGCITCGDSAMALRVIGVDADRGLATCEDEGGRREDVETALVADVSVGEHLLVHAGVALTRLDEAWG
jgi:hydrogenase maturation factor